MKITITTINFYPNIYWFWYFRKWTYIKGFSIRVFGIEIKVLESDATNKLIHIGNIQRLLRESNISYTKK
jgi:hypothetical protein